MQINQIKKLLCAAVFVYFVSGCSMVKMAVSPDVSISSKIMDAMREAQTFVGKDGGTVRARYGEPGDIRYDVYSHDGNTYEEVWYYKYDAGVPILAPNQYGIQFYFMGDVVLLVRN